MYQPWLKLRISWHPRPFHSTGKPNNLHFHLLETRQISSWCLSKSIQSCAGVCNSAYRAQSLHQRSQLPLPRIKKKLLSWKIFFFYKFTILLTYLLVSTPSTQASKCKVLKGKLLRSNSSLFGEDLPTTPIISVPHNCSIMYGDFISKISR